MSITQKIRELRVLLRNIKFPDTGPEERDKILAELSMLDEELWAETIALIDQHYETICGLAGNLVERVKEIGDEVVISAAELEALQAIREIVPV